MNAFVSVATASWLLGELARTTLLVAIVGLAAWLLLRTARVQSPALHRACCCFVLLAGWTFARWSVEVPWYEPPRVDVAENHAADEVAENHAADETALPPIDPSLLSPPGDLAAGSSFSPIGPDTTPLVPPPNMEAPNASPLPSFSWPQIALVAWLAGIAAIVVSWCFGYVRFLIHLPPEVPADSQWRDELVALQVEQGGRRRVELRVTQQNGPLLCRLPRGAVMLVPRQLWALLNVHERRAILQHELAHHRRGDLWKSLAVRVLALPHWFNPIVWLAVRRFDEAAEWACDRAAMGDEATAYARLLLRIGELVSVPARFGSAMSNRPLTTRIRRLLTLQSTEDSAMKKAILLSCLLLVAPLALVRVSLVAQEPEGSKTLPPPVAPQPGSFAPIDPNPVPPTLDKASSPYEVPAGVREAERKMSEAAKLAYEGTLAAYLAGNAPIESVITWSNRWLNAELSVAATRDEQRAAARGHLARMQERQTAAKELAKLQSRGGEDWAVAAANYYVADAERRLAEIEPKPELILFEPNASRSPRRPEPSEERLGIQLPIDEQVLRYDGKTFDQWTAQLKTDLSPSLRKDAMFAMAEFAKHGHGRHVAELIFETVQNYPIGNMNNSLEIPVKDAAIYAASRIHSDDLLRAVKQALQSENPNLRLFAILVLPLHDAKDQIIPLLLTAMNDKDSEVATASRESLAYLDHDNADLVAWIRTSLTSGEAKNILPALFLAKGRMGRNGINARLRFRSQASLAPEIVALLDHPERVVRDAASSSLLWEDDDLRGALVELAASDAPQAANARKLVEMVAPKRSREPAAKSQ